MHGIRQGLVTLACALCLALMPLCAYAAGTGVQAGSFGDSAVATDSNASASKEAESSGQQVTKGDLDDEAQAPGASKSDEDEQQLQAEKQQREEVQAGLKADLKKGEAKNKKKAEKEAKKAKEKAKKAEEKLEKAKQAANKRINKVLDYDRSDIDAIGTQERTGHSVCCPSFSCAYADAVMDGTVHDHSYYTCGWCTWKDWGGGGSYNRHAASNADLLREAYDQILDGKPTVIHVTYGWGEHWICLIGYKNAQDPDHLTLANFIALDPWDGAEVVAGDRFSLYGDCCEHISSR